MHSQQPHQQPTTALSLPDLKQHLLSHLTQARHTIQVLSASPPIPAAHVHQLIKQTSTLVPDILQYVAAVGHQADCLQKQVQLLGLIQQEAQNKVVPEKIVMYVWQVLNFICINQPSFQQELVSLLSPLFRLELSHPALQTPNSLKNGLIFYHNLLAKLLKQPQQYQMLQDELILLFGQIVAHHFNSSQQSANSLPTLGCSKPEATLLAEMEWLGLIFMQFFNNDFYSSKGQSLIEKLVKRSGDEQMGYYVLHMLGNYFQQMVDRRVTTELVAGYQCQIQEIKQMYSAVQECWLRLRISRCQLEYILLVLNQHILQYKHIVGEYLKLKLSQSQVAEIEEKWLRNTQILTQICHVLNNVLFIGGYNNKLQDLVSDTIMGDHLLLLSYLEVSYLLYRNVESIRNKSKVGLVVEMEKQVKKKLFAAVSLEVTEMQQIQIQGLGLDKMLAPGQLVAILRLLTNLVHINKRAQMPFQQQPKYLHMIMSLTHDSVSQATMKEWAIMFIRNVSEWSATLRQEIAKIQLQMKVE